MAAAWWVAGAAAAGLAGLAVWAALLPAEATAARTVRIAAPPERVFALVADAAGQPGWRSDVARVETGAPGSWVEHTTAGLAIAFREERREGGLYAVSFAVPGRFSGRWEGRVAAADGGTELAVTETVRAEGMVAKVLGRIFAPPGAHLDRYLADLRRAAEGG